jgi:hypothetical protein
MTMWCGTCFPLAGFSIVISAALPLVKTIPNAPIASLYTICLTDDWCPAESGGQPEGDEEEVEVEEGAAVGARGEGENALEYEDWAHALKGDDDEDDEGEGDGDAGADAAAEAEAGGEEGMEVHVG